MNKVIYNGFIYETALKVNTEMHHIAKTIVHELKTFSNYNPHTKELMKVILHRIEKDKTTNEEVSTPVTIKVLVHPSKDGKVSAESGYYEDTDFREAELILNVVSGHQPRGFENEINKIIYHELLHLIDPKQYNTKILKQPFNQEYIRPCNSKYYSQILEREQFLSSSAKSEIEKLVKDGIDPIAGVRQRFEQMFQQLPIPLQTPNERKVFAKLLYHYAKEVM